MSYGKKTRNPGWHSGDHWVRCDVCDLVYRNKDMMQRWDNAVVCKQDYEPRHPQDLIRGVKDDVSPKGFIRPDSVTEKNLCTTSIAVSGLAITGCAVAGRGLDNFVPTPVSGL